MDDPLQWRMVAHRGLGLNNNTTLSGAKYRYAARLSFAMETDKCTNNKVEYKAIILGLQKLRALVVKTYIVRIASRIVAGQIEKDCATWEPVLLQYLSEVCSLEKQFWGFTIQHIDKQN